MESADGKGDGDVSVDHFDEKIVESAAAARRTLSQRRGRARPRGSIATEPDHGHEHL